MKQYISLFAILLMLISCNSKKSSEQTKTDSTGNSVQEPVNKNNTEVSNASSIPVPTFTSPQVQNWANGFGLFAEQYIDIYKQKRVDEYSKIETKGNEWNAQVPEIVKKLGNDQVEIGKLNKFVNDLLTKMNDAVLASNNK